MLTMTAKNEYVRGVGGRVLVCLWVCARARDATNHARQKPPSLPMGMQQALEAQAGIFTLPIRRPTLHRSIDNWENRHAERQPCATTQTCLAQPCADKAQRLPPRVMPGTP